jgi:hypothetical protein
MAEGMVEGHDRWRQPWQPPRAAAGLTPAVGLVAIMVGFGAWWTYFDFAGHRKPRQTRAATVCGCSPSCR